MRLARVALAVLPLFAFACGSAASSGLSELPQDITYGGSGTSSSDGHKDAGAGGSGSSDNGTPLNVGSGSGSSSEGDAGASGTTTMACNGLSVKATLPPLNLVVMLDRSGSMGDGTNGDPKLKWDPVTAALESFLGDSSSSGMSASLQFFPAKADVCDVSSYSTQAVPFTTLPNATPFTTAISAIKPNGDTPSDQALTGALTYASAQRSADTTGAIYAAVLVTDGDPNGCSAPAGEAGAKQVGAVAATYATAADPILTYVIGVGQDSTYLNDIAVGGGTSTATMVSTTTSPTQTSTDLIAALNKIRAANIGCSYPIPAAPAGQTYDANAVNVNYTPSSGTTQTLPYDPSCTGNGWHYDSESAPTEIILCGQSCDEVKSGAGGSIDVVFGCATAGGIPGYDGGISIR